MKKQETFGLAIFTLTLFFALGFAWQSETPVLPEHQVHAPFNKQYQPEELGSILSWIDCGRALSAVAYHRGLMVAPISFDFGGGLGDGAFVAYNIDDPRNPSAVFDSRDYPKIYHGDEDDKNWLGDLGEHHGLYFHNDMVLLTDRGKERNGILILDLAPLYDDDPATLPQVVSRYHFPNVKRSTVYDGFTFAPEWVGGKYVYAPTGSSGLFIISTEDLANPRLLAHLTKQELYNETIRSVHAVGDLLVLSPAAVAVSAGKLVLLNVSDPAQPKLINKHTIKTGYQGIVYGSRFYNGAFAADRGAAKTAEIMAYDFADPMNVKNIDLGTTEELSKPEYVFVKDGDLFVGHYPGLAKFKVVNDSAILDVKVEPQHPPGNDYAFISPLGNLAIVTSDHEVESKLNIGVQQVEPDRKGPELEYVMPATGKKDLSPLTKIGLSFSDFIDNECLEKGAIYLREKGGEKNIPCGFSHGMGIVHAIPKKPLAKNRTYEVYATKNLMDMVGNPYEGDKLLTTFSTGSREVDYSYQIEVDVPKAVGKTVKFYAAGQNDVSPQGIEFAWDFGDGSVSEFSTSPKAKKTYDAPGNYRITLMTRPKSSEAVHKVTAVQVVYTPTTGAKAVSSSTLFVDESSGYLYVANPDNNTFTAIDPASGTELFEQPTGEHPVAIVGVGPEIWVSCQESDQIFIHDKQTGQQLATILLGHGASPYGITVNKRQGKAYVAFSGSGQLQEIDVKNRRLSRNAQLLAPLRNLSYLPKSGQLVAPQFFSTTQKGATVQWVDASTLKVRNKEELAPTLGQDGLANGRGYPGYLGPVAVNPEETNLWIPGKKDNLFRGAQRDGQPLSFDHTVRSIAVSMSIGKQKEKFSDRIDLDNNDFASAATFNAYGNILYVATMGTSTIWAVDAHAPGRHSVFSTYGEGACAMTMSAAGDKLFVHNQLQRSVAVFTSAPDGTLTYETSWNTVGRERMAANVLSGKQLFYNSARRNLSREGYMSCASCHLDGSHDGRTWDFLSLGEGLRNTIDLRGKAGMKHGILHWTGNFDELQDFDDQMHDLNEGTGFLFDIIRQKQRQFFPSKAGLHGDLDNIATYITSLDAYPRSPHKEKDGTMTQAALNGRKHFVKLKCYACHGGPTFTDSQQGLLHDVGTTTAQSGTRIGKPLKGFDTPTLISLWQSAPYLHDGSAATLDDVFKRGKDHGVVNEKLAPKERQELVAFLLQLDEETGITALEAGSTNQAPIFAQATYNFNYRYDYTRVPQRVGRVSAHDTDSDDQLTYQIVPSVYAKLFRINPKTGAISLEFNEMILRNIANKVLTIEETYPLQVVVTDKGDFARRSLVDVNIEVTYPEIPLDTKLINEFRKLRQVLVVGKSLNEKQRERFEELCAEFTHQ